MSIYPPFLIKDISPLPYSDQLTHLAKYSKSSPIVSIAKVGGLSKDQACTILIFSSLYLRPHTYLLAGRRAQ